MATEDVKTKTPIPPNLKKSPIPVVPRNLRIVNPDGTPTRSGQLLLEQLQDSIAGPAGPAGPSGGGGDVLGPVTGFTSAHEVGVRYAKDPDRLVHLTIGFVPIGPVPQSVTYMVSPDNGATWTWIGSQRMLTVGQVLKVDRLAPANNSTWKMACVAGNLGGDPTPIADVDLATLYPGVVRSAPFGVAGLAVPPNNKGITATIPPQQNVISADGFSQYGMIPAMIYTDPIGTTDFFVRVTVQGLDSSHAGLEAEHPYGGTQITGDGNPHTIPALLFPYGPGIAFMRYKIYTANRNSQGPGDFSDTSTNTLQLVLYNGSGTPALYYDLPITIPPFTPIAPEDVFNVLSVTASEVGPHYQDTNQGLHTTIGVIPVIDHDFSKPHTVTIWIDYGTGLAIHMGFFAMTAVGQVIRVGDSTLGTAGTRKAGPIWVPMNTAQGNWVVYCGPGQIDIGINYTLYPSYNFIVPPVGTCSPFGTTNCRFLVNPDTGDTIDYALHDPGSYRWEYYALTWTPPTLAQEPDFWFAKVTIQKGATISGVWTPAPDPEGANVDPTGQFLGRDLVEVVQLPGLANDQVSVVTKYGGQPASWGIPPAQNPDMSTNIYREFRFLMYNVSRLGTDTSGSGGLGTYTLQTTCWPGGLDHFILIPQPQEAAGDARALNPATIALPLTGGDGAPLGITPGGISSAYLGPQSVQAINMAQNSITAANQALAANSVVDPKIVSVGINKVTYGVSVFAGDVVLSRGIGLPVIVLQNTGIYLYGQADASTGATGLTSKPYVAVQNNAIGLFQGGAAGGSVFLDAAANAITIYSKNGDTTAPYFTANSGGLSVVDGKYAVTVTNTGIGLFDTTSSTITRELIVNSAGISIVNNNNSTTITASAIQLALGGSPRVTIDTTNGIVLSNGGASSVQITAATVSIINGTLNFANSGVTLNINPSISTPIGTVSGVAITSGSGATASWLTLTSSALSISDQVGATGLFASFARSGLIISTPTQQATLSPTGLQIMGLPSNNPGGPGRFYYNPLDGNRVYYQP